VANVRHVKNPIELARLVMDKSPHVLFVARAPRSSRSSRAWYSCRAATSAPPGAWLSSTRRAARNKRASARPRPAARSARVAIDRAGNLAAATSTGGFASNHPTGRVGDSPLIGAGTYANNESCAVSGTGHGESFIRQVVAYDVCAWCSTVV